MKNKKILVFIASLFFSFLAIVSGQYFEFTGNNTFQQGCTGSYDIYYDTKGLDITVGDVAVVMDSDNLLYSTLAGVASRDVLFSIAGSKFGGWTSNGFPSWKDTDKTKLSVSLTRQGSNSNGLYGSIIFVPKWNSSSYDSMFVFSYNYENPTYATTLNMNNSNRINLDEQSSRFTGEIHIVQKPCLDDTTSPVITINNYLGNINYNNGLDLSITDSKGNGVVPYVWTGDNIWTGNKWDINNQYGVDLSSIVVTVSGINNKVVLYSGDFEIIPLNKTWQNKDRDYRLLIGSGALFDFGVEEKVVITVDGVKDRNGNITSLKSLTINNPVRPTISNIYPANGSTFVPSSAIISFKALDAWAGINTGSILVVLSGINEDAEDYNYDFYGSALDFSKINGDYGLGKSGGYFVSLLSHEKFPALGKINVSVSLSDLKGNNTGYSWSFTASPKCSDLACCSIDISLGENGVYNYGSEKLYISGADNVSVNTGLTEYIVNSIEYTGWITEINCNLSYIGLSIYKGIENDGNVLVSSGILNDEIVLSGNSKTIKAELSGNTLFLQRFVDIDDVTLITPIGGIGLTTGNVEFQWSLSGDDDKSWFSGYIFTLYSGNNIIFSKNVYSTTIILSGDESLLDGIYERSVVAEDLGGHRGETKTGNFIVDKTGPDFEILNRSGYECEEGYLEIGGERDVLSSILEGGYSFDGINWGTGKRIIIEAQMSTGIVVKTGYVRDELGNTTEKTGTYEFINTGVSVETGILYIGTISGEVRENINDLIGIYGAREGNCGTGGLTIELISCSGATGSIEGGELKITPNNEVEEDGECEMVIKDGEGSEKYVLLEYSIDTQAPICIMSYSPAQGSGKTNQDVIVIFDCGADGSTGYTFTGNGNTELSVKDEAGNETTGGAVVDWIDRTAPECSVSFDVETWTSGNVNATLSCIDSGEVTVIGGTGHEFTENGEYTFEYVDEAGNTGSTEAEVTWIDRTAPECSVSFDVETWTSGNVNATLSCIDSGEVTVIGGTGHEFTENGKYTFEYVDEAGNTGSTEADVTWIDRTEPECSVSFDVETWTSGNVNATLSCIDSGEVTVIGGTGHEFTENGKYTFEYRDEAGNTGSTEAEVTWIDRTAPECSVSFDVETWTSGNVNATLSCIDSGEVTVIGGTGHEFTENGEYTFEYRDEAGNTGSIEAEVTWIDRTEPECSVSFDVETWTSGNVNATLSCIDSGEVTVIGGTGHEFTENGEYTFEYRDEAGNTGSTEAEVTWIDRTAPECSVSFDVETWTSGNVNATLSCIDSGEVTVIGGTGHEFTENGKYTFEYRDEAGNTGSTEAEVTWIDKTSPEIVSLVGGIGEQCTNIDTFIVTGTFSESVIGVTRDTLIITNGTIQSVNEVSGSVYEWTVKLTGGTGSISIVSGTVTDLVGNSLSGLKDLTLGNYDNEDPNSVSLLAPANTSTIYSTNVDFLWSESIDNGCAGIDNYRLEVCSDSACNTIVRTGKLQITGTTEHSFDNGTWYWRVVTTDKNGNSENSSIGSFVVDSDNPTCTITQQTSCTTGDVSLILTGSKNFVIISDGEIDWIGTGTSYSGIAEHNMTGLVEIQDLGGNIGSCSFEVSNHDVQGPVITDYTGITVEECTNTSINVQAIDNGCARGVQYKYGLDYGTNAWQDIGKLDITTIGNKGGIIKSQIISVRDLLFNENTYTGQIVVLDVKPTLLTGLVSIEGYLSGNMVLSDVKTVFGVNEGNCGNSDIIVSVSECNLVDGILNNGDLQIQTHSGEQGLGYCVLSFKDNENNEITGRVEFQVDTKIPECEIIMNTQECTSGIISLSLSGKSTDIESYKFIDNVRKTWRANIPIGVTEIGNYSATVLDNAGNVGSCSIVVTNEILDDVGPSITDVVNWSGYECSTGSASLTTVDQGCGSGSLMYNWGGLYSGIDYSSYSIYRGTTGTQTIIVVVKDEVGNEISTGVKYTWNDVELTGSDFTVGGIGNETKTINWKDSGNVSAGTCEEISVVSIEQGSHGICSTGEDNTIIYSPSAGYEGEDTCRLKLTDGDTEKIIEIIWTDIDTLKPTCSISQNPINSIWTSGNVVLTLNTTGASNYKWNAGSRSTENTQLTVSEIGENKGYVKDEVGNTGECRIEITNIDKEIPTVVLEGTNTEGCTNKAEFTVTGTFSEDVYDFDEEKISITNGTISEFSGIGKVYTWKVTMLGGETEVKIEGNKVVDKAGNANSESNSLISNYDNSGPYTPSMIWPINGGTVYKDSIDLEWNTVSDIGCVELSGYYYKVCEDELCTMIFVEGFTTGTKAGLGSLEGGDTYYWELYAVDKYGQESNISSGSFDVDLNGISCRISQSACSSTGVMLTLEIAGSGDNLSWTGEGRWLEENTLTKVVTTPGITVTGYVYDSQTNRTGECTFLVTNIDQIKPIVTGINVTGYECEVITGSVETSDEGCGNGTLLYKWNAGDFGNSTVYGLREFGVKTTDITVVVKDSVDNETTGVVVYEFINTGVSLAHTEINLGMISGQITTGDLVELFGAKEGNCGIENITVIVSGCSNAMGSIISHDLTIIPESGIESEGECELVFRDDENSETIGKIEYIVDTKKPTCSIQVKETQSCTSGDASLVLSGTAIDIEKYGFDGITWTDGIIGETTVNELGIYTGYVMDEMGNIGTCTVDVSNTILDKETPEIKQVNEASGNECEVITGSVETSDEGCGSGSLMYSWSGLDFVSDSSFGVQLNNIGTETITVVVKDEVGNEISTGVKYTWNDVELTGSDFTVGGIGNETKTINWKDSGNVSAGTCEEISVISIEQGSHGICSTGEDNTIIYSPSAGYEGEDTCRLKLTDGDTEKTIEVVWTDIDIKGPEIVSLVGGVGETCTNEAEFIVTGTFSEAVTGVFTDTLTVVNGTVKSVIEVSGSVYEWTVKLTGGTGTVSIVSGVVNDLVGNSLSGSKDLILGNYDILGPSLVRLISPNDNYHSDLNEIVFEWNSATDNGCAEIKNYMLTIYSGDSIVETRTITGTTDSIILENGTYTWGVVANDNYGNIGTGEKRTVIIESINPTCQIEQISACTSGDVSLDLIASKNVSITSGNANWIGNGRNYSGTINSNILVRANIEDAEGKTGRCEFIVTGHDSQGPVVNFTGFEVNECTEYELNISATDEDCAGISGYKFGIDFGGNERQISNRMTILAEEIGRTGGDRQQVVSVIDNFGYETTVTGNVKIVDVPLTIATSGIDLGLLSGDVDVGDLIEIFGANEGNCGTGDIEVSISECIGATTNLQGTELSLQLDKDIEGDGYCLVTFVDNEGSGKQVRIDFEVDTLEPECSLTVQTESCTRGDIILSLSKGTGDISRYNFNNEGFVSWTGNTTVSINQLGNYGVEVVDKAGNIGTCTVDVSNAILDKETPEIKQVNEASGNECEVITGSVETSDEGCGSGSLMYSWSGLDFVSDSSFGVQLNNIGTETITVVVKDEVGNEISTGVKYTWNDVELTGSDFTVGGIGNETKIINWKDSGNVSAGTCEEISVVSIEQGSHGICSTGEDNTIIYSPLAGYEGEDTCRLKLTDGDTEKIIEIIWTDIDTLKPTCSISQNPINSIWTSGNVVLTLNTTGASNYKWNAGSRSTENTQLTVSEIGENKGYVKDEVGNTGECRIEITNIDKEIPTVVLEGTNTAGCTNKAEFTVTGTFSEDVYDFDEEKISITNGTISEFSGIGKVYTWKVTMLGGETEVKIEGNKVVDKAGNANSESNSLISNYDNNGPTAVTLLNPTNGSTVYSTGITLQWSVGTDSGCAEISEFTYRLCFDENCNTIIGNGSTGDLTVSFDDLGSGDYYWKVQAVDTFGQTGSISTGMFTINTDGISCSITETSCSNTGVILTLVPVGSGTHLSWTGGLDWVEGASLTLVMTENGIVTGYVFDEGSSRTGSCTYTVSNVDKENPEITVHDVQGWECEIITGSVTANDVGCGVGNLMYNWTGDYGLFTEYSLFKDKPTTQDVEISVKDGAGNITTGKVNYLWNNTGLQMQRTEISGMVISGNYAYNKGAIEIFGVSEGNCGTGDIFVVSGNCENAILSTIYSNLTIEPAGNIQSTSGSCEVIFTTSDTGDISTGVFNFLVDTQKPTCTISYSPEGGTSGNVVATLIECSESITVINNEGNEIRTQYTFTGDGEFIFEFEDNAGNTGSAKATVSTESTSWIDRVNPTVLISAMTGQCLSEKVITITGVFSEAVNGVEIGDITVVNGVASGFNVVSNTVYEWTIELTGGEATVSFDSGIAVDFAQNPNVASDVIIIGNYDSLVPSKPELITPVDGMYIDTIGIDFEWSGSVDPGCAGLSGYNLQICEDDECNTILETVFTTGTSIHLTPTYTGELSRRVISVDNNGNENVSDVSKFINPEMVILSMLVNVGSRGNSVSSNRNGYESTGKILFYASGDRTEPILSGYVSIDHDGSGVINMPVVVGCYDIVYKGWHHLSSFLSGVCINSLEGGVLNFVTGNNIYGVETLDLENNGGYNYLIAGDMPNGEDRYDNIINGSDLSVLYGSRCPYLSSVSKGHLCDLNNDGLVDSSDASVVLSNLNKSDSAYHNGLFGGFGFITY